jgi:1,4-alpha-glucan branching enzyme
VQRLNSLYRREPALYERDDTWEGFDWLDLHDANRSILSFLRRSARGEAIIACCNFTPMVRHQYRLGVPVAGAYHEILNSDASEYGGSGVINGDPILSEDRAWHNQPYSIEFTLPPLGIVFLRVPVSS